MSETLKPCPFCGGEAEAVHEINGFWTVECTKCGALVDGIAAWNTRAADKPDTFHDDFYDCESTVDAGEDNREKLEADARDLQARIWRAGATSDGISISHIIELLDRQAAITERECREYENALREQHHKRIDALTAERDEWKNVADELREEVTSLYAKMVRIKKVMGE